MMTAGSFCMMMDIDVLLSHTNQKNIQFKGTTPPNNIDYIFKEKN